MRYTLILMVCAMVGVSYGYNFDRLFRLVDYMMDNKLSYNGQDSTATQNCAGIISRAAWGARPPKERANMKTPVSMVFVHHTAGSECFDRATCSATVRSVQNFHMDTRGWSDIGYSFLVGEDGNAYEGRGWTTVGAHTRGYNSRAIAVSVMGNFMTKTPNDAALKAVQDVIACGVAMGYIREDYELFGHRDGGCTSCPGDQLYATIQGWPRFSRRPIKKYCL